MRIADPRRDDSLSLSLSWERVKERLRAPALDHGSHSARSIFRKI
jgi:hypothetical protein